MADSASAPGPPEAPKQPASGLTLYGLCCGSDHSAFTLHLDSNVLECHNCGACWAPHQIKEILDPWNRLFHWWNRIPGQLPF